MRHRVCAVLFAHFNFNAECKQYTPAAILVNFVSSPGTFRICRAPFTPSTNTSSIFWMQKATISIPNVSTVREKEMTHRECSNVQKKIIIEQQQHAQHIHRVYNGRRITLRMIIPFSFFSSSPSLWTVLWSAAECCRVLRSE